VLRVGIVGLGCMGVKHFWGYKALEDVSLVAICDIDQSKFTSTSGTVGNVGGTKEVLDFTGIKLYSDFEKMLSEVPLDAVSITLPTYLHAQYVTKAFDAGINVLAEKPMALDLDQCQAMIDAAEKSGKTLQIGHCVRFWPEYAKTKQIIDSGRYGRVLIATFQRLSATPTWSWNNWLLDNSKSGGAALDLHIHDSDIVQYWFGMPKAVLSAGSTNAGGGYDHIVTQFIYDDGKVITAEGGWMMAPGFGFQMSFHVVMEKATITYDCSREPAFRLCPTKGDVITPEIESGDGYSLEIAHFVKILAGEKLPAITRPQQSRDSVRIVQAEVDSARTGKKISLT